MDAEAERDRFALPAILANLSREICQPIDLLQGGIGVLLGDPSKPITDAERSQAEIMLMLCNDLGRLTRECLGDPEASEG
jgi:hypothetical protein